MQDQKHCQSHNQSIKYICFDEKCINQVSQIMCVKCSDNHNNKFHDHRVIQYSSFKKYLQTFRKQIDYDQLKEIIRDQFSVLRKDVNKYINDLQDSALSSISLQFDEERQFQVFQGEITLLAKNQLFKKFVINPSSINMVKEEMKIKNINLMKEIRSLNEQIKRMFEMGQKDIDLPKLDNKFLFSLKNKHENVEVMENGTTIKRLSKDALGKKLIYKIGHSQLAVCRQPFSPISNKIEFQLKEMSTKGCIAVGACLLSTVEKLKFFRCWQLGEGAYSLFMNTFGFVKSNHHSDKMFSNAFVKVTLFLIKKGWKFRKGDLISVQIDFMKERIIFTKNRSQKFSMPINIEGQKLYPFAAISYLGDMVQIV